MIRQRVYQIAAGYEDCNDADSLRIDPALRLALGKGEAQREVAGMAHAEGEKIEVEFVVRDEGILARRRHGEDGDLVGALGVNGAKKVHAFDHEDSSTIR
jgi:hypothetical protein